MEEKESIKYQPSSKMARVLLTVGGKVKRINSGDEVVRGDVPDEVFYGLAARPDFGGDLARYAHQRGSICGDVDITRKLEDSETPKSKDIDTYEMLED